MQQQSAEQKSTQQSGRQSSMANAGDRRLHPSTIFFVALFHLLSLAAIFTFSWGNLLSVVILYWISGSFGIGMGYHRLLTHRGYKVPKFIEYTMAFCGTLALQSGPISWVTTHRLHHAFTDQENDPHSPRHGIFWSHMGWIFQGTAQTHSEAVIKRYSPDLAKDRFYILLEKYYYVPTILLGIGLLAFGGFPLLVWGLFVRTVFGWHSTWLVNSATHLWGTRRFETNEDSRNNPLIAAITFGEGWHNNHHAYPRSSRHGIKWYEIDLNWIQIKALEMVGIARDVYAYSEKRYKPVSETESLARDRVLGEAP